MKIRFFMVLLCILFLTGCWNREELNELGIVSALGIDKDDRTGKIILTTQMVRPEAMKRDSIGGSKPPVEIVTTEGDTVFEALRNITKKFDRRAYLTQTKVVVINENVAKEGLLPIIDLFSRVYEVRKLSWLIIAKGTTAREALGAKDGIETIQGAYLNNILERRIFNSEVSASDLLDFLVKAYSHEINPISGVMEISEKSNLPAEGKKQLTTEEVKFTGTAVFKKDKLVGYLNESETRGLNWITGKVKSGIINVPSPVEKDKLIAVMIKGVRSSIKSEIRDGKILLTIEVKEEGDIYEQQDSADYFKDLELLSKLEANQNEVIEKEIRMAVDKLQKDLDSDILGFGSVFSKKYPKEWKNIKADWENIFPKVAYEVKVNGKLKRLGLVKKTINSAND